MGSLPTMYDDKRMYSNHNDEDPDFNKGSGWDLLIQIILIVTLLISIKNCS